ncbi:MAG: hypothetical protein A3K19_28310 [Lentisphaerae bacterium RIFOXYB12_FULL_65_16]|nr:MAG: hypothetical protein A3K18_19560 [Lentisphaerae bacterium RIFOXYA12_64_32]OGV85493.1 MAG: hypothetical protein A3K19_28310 [Lentisphaerae bacterium RIFOXYB12_FULL_65_16]
MLVGIFGTGRNGSTLLVRLLDGIPTAFVQPLESNYLSAMNDLARFGQVRRITIQNATVEPLQRLVDSLPTARLLDFYRHQIDTIRGAEVENVVEPVTLGQDPLADLARQPSYTAQAFVPAYLRALANWLLPETQMNVLLFKTIETPYIADYERLFPEMRFIHLIRNPLDVWSSQKRSLMCNKTQPSWYLGGDNLRTMIECRWLPHARAILERKNSPRHYLLRYEDLVKDAARVVGDICAWLGVPLPRDPTSLTTLGGRHYRTMPKNPSKRDAVTPREVVADLAAKLHAEDVVTPREQDLILYRAYDAGRQLGYFQGLRKSTKGHIVRRWCTVDEWEFKHASGVRARLRGCWAMLARRCYVGNAILEL